MSSPAPDGPGAAGPLDQAGKLGLVELGERPYQEMLAAQEDLVAARRRREIPDLLLILEHPPVFTRGRRSEPDDLGRPPEWYEERGIAVCDTPRGGKVTYHGPGQLVAYPIINLDQIGTRSDAGGRIAVARFVSSIEQAMARTLDRVGIQATAIAGLTGLWTSSERPIPEDATGESMSREVANGQIAKIASIGLLISRGISSHGLSINVSCDLDPFSWITSCGIEQCRITSVARELAGGESTEPVPSVNDLGRQLAGDLAAILGLGPVSELDPDEIGLSSAVAPTA